MPNCPDYLACWLGISRMGAVVALINNGLRGQSLAHCINVAAPAHVIVAEAFWQSFESARPFLKDAPQIWSPSGAVGGEALATALDAAATVPLSSSERRDVTIDDRALLIYTSGTTG